MTMHHMQPHFVKAERIDPSFLPPSYHLQQQQLELQRQQLQQQQQQQQQLHHQQQQQQQQQYARQMAPHINTASRPVHPDFQQSKKTAAQNGTEEQQNIESLPDFPSIKGIFGWTTLDNVNIPYILRQDKQFVSVRIVEMKLLSRYPNSYPDDLGKHAPLTSFFITTNEAKLLNEINLHHCAAEYGKKEFTQKDLIVLLSDFTKFYELVKKTFPDPKSARDSVECSTAGWLQIKNTVTPYVKRQDGKYVPLSVIQYAAGLLVGERVAGSLPTTKECLLLNDSCKTAGVEFTFSETTRLIKVSDIQRVAQVEIIELPNANPLKHATYMELPTTSNTPVVEKTKTVTSSPQVSQKTQQPYRFQPTAQMEMMRSQLHDRMGSTEPNGGRFTHPFLNPPMFDPKLAALSQLYRLPFSDQPPLIPPPGQNIRPPPYPTIPPNMINPLNPMMQYYLGMQNNHSVQKPPMQGPPNRTVASQPLPGSLTGPVEHPSRSPGASSSNPSPRSRPPSLSRPPSGSRPPSESPLSPTSPSHIPGRSPNYPLNPDSLPLSSPQNFGGTSLQHMQQMYVQRFPGPVPPSMAPSATNQGIRLPSEQIRLPSEPMKHIEPLKSPTQTNHGLPPGIKDANQEIPGLFSPTGTSVVLEKPNPVTKPRATDIGAPPPLLLMPNPNISRAQSPPSQPNENTSATSVPTPTMVVAAPGQVVPAPRNTEPPQPQPVGVVKQTLELYTAKIKGAWLNSKSISCLHLEKEERKGRYCLVEAVCKLYFNGCSVNEFLFALENVLNVPLLTCSDEEEKAFIQYYSLPVDVLKCNKMIKFDDLENFFPQLSYMFPDKNSQDMALTQDSEDTIVHDVNFGQENNNIDKEGMTNGRLTEEELEAAMPGVMSDMVPQPRHKRAGDSLDGASSPKRIQGETIDMDDAVIILD